MAPVEQDERATVEAWRLQLLLAAGFVGRRKDGLYARYRIADEDVFRICEIMCGRLEVEARSRRHLLAGR